MAMLSIRPMCLRFGVLTRVWQTRGLVRCFCEFQKEAKDITLAIQTLHMLTAQCIVGLGKFSAL